MGGKEEEIWQKKKENEAERKMKWKVIKRSSL